MVEKQEKKKVHTRRGRRATYAEGPARRLTTGRRRRHRRASEVDPAGGRRWRPHGAWKSDGCARSRGYAVCAMLVQKKRLKPGEGTECAYGHAAGWREGQG